MRNCAITKFKNFLKKDDHLGQGNTSPSLVQYLIVGNEICPKT